ncbi:MAG: OmpA family protein [Chloroflexota bacterium]
MKRLLVYLITAFCLAQSGAFAQGATGTDFTWPMNFGLYGGPNMNMHTPSFTRTFDGANAQGIWRETVTFDENKNDFGMNFGLVGNFALNGTLTLSLRLGYNGLNGTLTKDNGGGDSTHNFKATLPYFEIQPSLQFHNILPIRNMYFKLAPEISIPLAPVYEYKKEPVPSFQNRRFIDETELEDPALRIAAVVGLGYVFDLSRNVFLTPELSYHFPFTNVSSNDMYDSWKVPQLRLSIALTYGFFTPAPPARVESEASASPLAVGFSSVRFFDRMGNLSSARKITVEEIQYAELFPLVPYVFFPENGATPAPATQVTERSRAGSFDINNLEPDAVGINTQTMNIVGKRMQNFPDANVTITGTVDSKTESGKKDLAQQRAEFVKNYLISNFGVSTVRLNTVGNGKPGKASSENDPEGVAENRRAEFSTQHPEILAPIVIQHDKDRIADPSIVRFTPYANSGDAIAHWDLTISQSGRKIKSFSGSGAPREVTWNISPNDLAANEIPVDYTFAARTIRDVSDSESGSIPVEFISSTMRKPTEERPDRTISKFSLVLFDFNSPAISEQDRNIIDKYIIPAIKFNSTVQIYGYTDRIGESDYNKKLATDRANTVRSYIEGKMRNAKYEVYGVGEGVEIYDNDLTVGRQLSRTVQVYVITPKQP